MSLSLGNVSSHVAVSSHEVLGSTCYTSNMDITGNAKLVRKSDGTINCIPKTPAYVFGEQVLRPLIDRVSALFSYLVDRLPSLPGAHAHELPSTNSRIDRNFFTTIDTAVPIACPNELLLNAIMDNDFVRVRESLNDGANPNTPDQQRASYALHVACEKGNSLIVRELLDWGALPNARNSRWKDTPLHRAALKGDTAVIKELIKRNAEINAPNANNGQTPLDYAISSGSVNSCKLLLDSGASAVGLTGRDKPLDKAIRAGHYLIVEMLLQYGADAGSCNLINAVHRPDILELLLDNEANIHQYIPHNDPHYPGDYPIHAAARSGIYDSVSVLLTKGADPAVKNKYNRTPVDEARKSLEFYVKSPPMMKKEDTEAVIRDLEQTIKILS